MRDDRSLQHGATGYQQNRVDFWLPEGCFADTALASQGRLQVL
jgi:hypothetical protein